MEYYANSSKQKLKEHLQSVANTTSQVITTCLSNFDEQLVSQVTQASYLAGLHHDDGKADLGFQEYITTKKASDNWFETKPLHHELSLLTLDYFISDQSVSIQKAIQFAIYYHHSERKRKAKLKDVITDYVEFDSYHKYISDFHGIDFKQDYLLKVADSYTVPNFFNPYKMKENGRLLENVDNFKQRLDQDILNHLTKFTLVTADRYISRQSSLDSISTWSAEYDDTNLREAISMYKDLPELQGERSDNQLKAAQSVGDHTSTVVAGAGSGKTRLALLSYLLKSKQKGLMWVCPRTAVCDSLLDELSQVIPTATLSVVTGDGEVCYQGGEIIDGNAWQSDVIITTIDQVVSTLARHTNVENFKEYLTRYCVFDEYHETLDILELYYPTMLLMRLKAKQSYSHINISATPTPFHLMCINNGDVDSWKNPIKMQSFNTKPITVNFVPETPFDVEDTIYIFNTAKTAQECAIQRWLEDKTDFMLYHSRYNPEDRLELTKTLLDRFGKSSTHKDLLYSSPLSQASLNISRGNLVSELTSPSAALQRLGRLNRFAENDHATAYFLVNPNTAVDFSKGKVKNTNSYQFNIVRNKIVSTYNSFYPRSSFDFYLKIARKLTGNKNINKLCGQSFTTNTTELTDLYFRFLVASISNSTVSDYVNESYVFINQAITYLQHRDLFKPVKITLKKDKNVKVSGGFRNASIFANLTKKRITQDGIHNDGWLTDNSDTSKLVSLGYSEVQDIDFNKVLKSENYPKGFAKSVKYRAKNSGLTIPECMCNLARISDNALVISDKLAYFSVNNRYGDLKIGHFSI